MAGTENLISKNTDVVIVGGGVIGCSIAYQLAKQGVRATVLERGRFGSGASGATAGVIGPLWHLDPAHKAVFGLGMRSLDLFPQLASELAEAGVDPEFQHRGILKVAFAPKEVDELKQNLTWQGELGLGVRWLDAPEIRELEPEMDDGVLGGVFSPREGCINGQRLVDALVHAATLLGAMFLEETEVTGLEISGQSVVGVRTLTGYYECGHTVLAAGPWTGIAGRWLPQALPISPVKGQRILLRKPGFLPKCPVRSFEGYVVPQANGSLLVAATREEGAFDVRITANAIRQLVATAIGLFPALEDASFVGARAGVRPGSPDGIPIMGPVPGWDGVSVACGHDHAGVMLSPGSAELVARYILDGDPRPLEAFSISRFGASASE
jgi:glycine oxidase